MKYNAPFGAVDLDAPYVNGNPSTGTPGSIPPAQSIEHPQREIVNAILKAGLVPNQNDLTQLSTAIKTISTKNEDIALNVQSGQWNYGEAQGSANAITLNLLPAPKSLKNGFKVSIKVKMANTNSVTLNVNNLGPRNLLDCFSGALTPGYLIKGSIIEATYNGKAFIITPTSSRIQQGGIRVFDTRGAISFTFPDGVNRVWAEVYGGGGGASLYVNTSVSTTYTGEGGGGGGYAAGWVYGHPGKVITGHVGKAGMNKGHDADGFDGGTSTFGGIGATGGTGGTMSGFAGVGGMGYGGLINLQGQTGVDGNHKAMQFIGFGGNCAGPHGGLGANWKDGAHGFGGGGMLAWDQYTLYAHGEPTDGGIILFW